MRKLILAALLFSAVSCSNPEDRATGDTDSSSFNSGGETFNTPPGGFSDSTGSMGSGLDTSAAPALDKKTPIPIPMVLTEVMVRARIAQNRSKEQEKILLKQANAEVHEIYTEFI